MAKAALEAINGCNLFGEKGSSVSVIYVDIDAHNRNRSIFETLLPRESSSKVNIVVSVYIPRRAFYCGNMFYRIRMHLFYLPSLGHVFPRTMTCSITALNPKLSDGLEATTDSNAFSEMAMGQSWKILIVVFITKAKLEFVPTSFG